MIANVAAMHSWREEVFREFVNAKTLWID